MAVALKKPMLFPWFVLPLILMISSATAQQTCKNYSFSNNKTFSSCTDLPFLSSFLHWNYNGSDGSVEIAYRRPDISTPYRWVAWAINPTSQGMIRAQALVAFQGSNGTMKVYTAPLTSYGTDLQEGKLSFDVSDISAVFEDNEIIIFASLKLPNNGATTVNQVWQEGPLDGGHNAPKMHGMAGVHLKSFGSLDFLSG